MTDDQKHFSGLTRCGHCGNEAQMEIGAVLSQMEEYGDPRSGPPWEEGPVHQVLVCPACKGVVLQRYYWHELMDPGDVEPEALYPVSEDLPVGLPAGIEREYEAALKVRSASPNAYGVLLGRLLELVCEDREAKGGSLSAKLRHLADKGELPQPLVGVAERLTQLRDVGAHASLGELTSGEIPVLEKLNRAILEYIYSAPHLAKEAQDRLLLLRASQRKKKGRKEKVTKKRKT